MDAFCPFARYVGVLRGTLPPPPPPQRDTVLPSERATSGRSIDTDVRLALNLYQVVLPAVRPRLCPWRQPCVAHSSLQLHGMNSTRSVHGCTARATNIGTTVRGGIESEGSPLSSPCCLNGTYMYGMIPDPGIGPYNFRVRRDIDPETQNQPVGLGFPHLAGRYRHGGCSLSSPGCWVCRCTEVFLIQE